MRALAVALVTLALAGCVGDAVTPGATVSGLAASLDVDVLSPGELAVETVAYDFGRFLYTDAGVYSLPIRGEAYLPEGDGPWPVVVVEHGRHPTCNGIPYVDLPIYVPVAPPECPSLGFIEPIDSYRGYAYLGENLASHGYAVFSVDANPINAMDGTHDTIGTASDAGGHARGELVLRTLDELRDRNDGEFGGALDLTRIGLMGHSRGGEGVVLALNANQARAEGERHGILAVFSLAPIDRNAVVADGAAFATVLPACDGDVWTLSGARIFDDSREAGGFPRSQVLVMGANHNFYNTVWAAEEYGDDGRFWEDDPSCSPDARPTEEEQRAEGTAHINGFFRLHLGNESAFAPLFDGTAGLPEGACPAAIPCERAVHVSHEPADGRVRAMVVRATGFASETECDPEDCKTDAHVAGSAKRHVLAWNGPATLAAAVPPGTTARAVSFRIAFDPAASANGGLAMQDLRVEVTDAAGHVAATLASAHSTALFVLPFLGEESPGHVLLDEVRIPIEAFGGIDPASVREVRLVFDATPSGEAHVADLGVLR